MTLRFASFALVLLASACTAPAADGTSDGPSFTAPAEAATDKAAWTVMVYMVGDNNLEPYALADFNEMEEVGSTPDVQVAVQLDRSRVDYGSDTEWDGARRFHVAQDDDAGEMTSPALEDLGRTDSGSATMVVDFVEWAVDAWPADHYALVIWNHGGGWRSDTKDVGVDDGAHSALDLTDGDLREALAGSVAATGQRLDVLGFDACLMQTWEVEHDAAPYADFLVGSQELEPGEGWDYTAVLERLTDDPSMGGEAAAITMVDSYADAGPTLSAVDLAAVSGLDSALDTLSDAMLALPDPAAPLAEAEAAAWTSEGIGIDRDLGQVLEVLALNEDPAVAAAALGVLEAMDEAVVATVSSQDYAELSGISIFTGFQWVVPYLTDPNFDAYTELMLAYRMGSWAAEGRWDDLVVPVTLIDL